VRNPNTVQRVFELADGEIQSRDRQRKHALTRQLARAAHRPGVLRSSVATYCAVPVKR